MAVINNGVLPLINDVVTKIEIEGGGVRICFKSGASFFGHFYTKERPFVNVRQEELTEASEGT